jgi:hypothetical protein
LNIDTQTFYNYASGKKEYETYFDICTRIRNIIDSQHFEGGMAGTFNAGIVTRKLGLAEKTNNEVNVNFPKIEVKDQDTASEVEKLIRK